VTIDLATYLSHLTSAPSRNLKQPLKLNPYNGVPKPKDQTRKMSSAGYQPYRHISPPHKDPPESLNPPTKRRVGNNRSYLVRRISLQRLTHPKINLHLHLSSNTKFMVRRSLIPSLPSLFNLHTFTQDNLINFYYTLTHVFYYKLFIIL
jgi:hypothetical protein